MSLRDPYAVSLRDPIPTRSHYAALRDPKQSRAIVLNRFGLALIGRIAPDRSDTDYVRRTCSTKRLRTIVLLCRAAISGRSTLVGSNRPAAMKGVLKRAFDHGSRHAVATVVVYSLEAFMSPLVQRDGKPVNKPNRRELSCVPIVFGTGFF